jgi:hypothetical protein
LRGALPKAPHIRLNFPVLRVEHDDALVAITVGGVHLFSGRVDEHIRRLMDVSRCRRCLALAAVADLHDELPAIVNFRIMSSLTPGVVWRGQPARPPIQMKSFASTKMPCSRPSHTCRRLVRPNW